MAPNTQTNVAKDLLQGSFKALLGDKATTTIAQKIAHANDNSNVTTIGMPSTSSRFTNYKVDQYDIVKAIQKVADNTVVALNTLQNDAKKVNTFVARTLQEQQDSINVVGRKVDHLKDSIASNTDEISRLKYKLAKINADSLKTVGVDASNDLYKRKEDPVAAGGGNMLTQAAMTAMLLKMLPGAIATLGLSALGLGTHAVRQSDEAKKNEYPDDVKKYGKEKADRLNQIRNSGITSKLNNALDNVWEGRAPWNGPKTPPPGPGIAGNDPNSGEVTDKGQYSPGFFNRMLEQTRRVTSLGGILDGTTGTRSSTGIQSGTPSNAPASFNERFTGQAAPPTFRPGIGGAVGRPATGSLAVNQNEAYQTAIKEGLSDKAARSLVANMSGESLRKPSDEHWDVKHMSQGIVQWDPQRAGAIEKQFGKLPKDMSVAEQTKAAIWEMKTNPSYKQSWDTLNNPNASHQEMVSALVTNYERPANAGAAISQRMGHLASLPKEFGANVPVETKGTPAQVAIPPGFKLGSGQLASVIGPDGKMSTMVTGIARQKLIDGMGEDYKKLPQGLKDHIEKSSQLDMNEIAKYQNQIPESVKKGFADNGLTFTPGKDAVAAIPGTKPQPVLAGMPGAQSAFKINDRSGVSGVTSTGKMDNVQGMIIHHTGARGDVSGVENTLKDRNLGVQFVIDREGTVHQLLPDGSKASHMKTGWGEKGAGKSNSNMEGVEIIAKDDRDVTPAQKEAAAKLVGSRAAKWGYDPKTSVFGHGEVNPGHKEADEGMGVTSGIRAGTLDTAGTPNADATPAPTKTPTTIGDATAVKLTKEEQATLKAAPDEDLPDVHDRGDNPVGASDTSVKPPQTRPTYDQMGNVTGQEEYDTPVNKVPDASPVQPYITPVDRIQKVDDPMGTGDAAAVVESGKVADKARDSRLDQSDAPQPSAVQKMQDRSGPMTKPTHHPEQMSPGPGNDGYGQKSDPEHIGICSI